MTGFEVDPDSLTAAAQLAERQHGHLASTSGYVDSVCGRTGAFSGVLNLFQGSYEQTLHNARTGMTDSQTVATKVRESMTASREDYLAQDKRVYLAFRKALGDEVDLPPYVAPGGGDSSLGGPSGAPPTGPGTPEDPQHVELEKLPTPVDAPLNKLVPGDDERLPGWLDPKGGAKDQVLLGLHTHADREHYLDLRQQGMTPEQARSVVRPDVDDLASQHVHDSTERRAESAYDDAYQSSRDAGGTHDQATGDAQQAASDQRHGDAVDHRNRTDVLGAAGTYKGAYDQVSDAVDNVNDLRDHVDQLHETTDDLGDYDRFEDQPDDTSAQDWGNR